MKLDQSLLFFGGGGVYLKLLWNVRGSAHIFNRIWSNYRENLQIFCFFAVGSQNFPFKTRQS